MSPIDLRAETLVVSGPSRVSRNPMYLGMAGLLSAHALLRRSGAAWVPVAGFVVAIDRLQIPAEEAALRQRFGDEYERYVAVTPRWIGLPRMR